MFGLFARNSNPLAFPFSDASIACRAVDGFRGPSPHSRRRTVVVLDKARGILMLRLTCPPSLHGLAISLFFSFVSDYSCLKWRIARKHSPDDHRSLVCHRNGGKIGRLSLQYVGEPGIKSRRIFSDLFHAGCHANDHEPSNVSVAHL